MKKARKILLNRILASVLSFAMIAGTVPMSVFAEGEIVTTVAAETVEDTETTEGTESIEAVETEEEPEAIESLETTDETIAIMEKQRGAEENQQTEVFIETQENLLAEVTDEEESTNGSTGSKPVYVEVLSNVSASIGGNGTDHVSVNINEANLVWQDAGNGREAGWWIGYIIRRDMDDTESGEYNINSNYFDAGMSGEITGPTTEIWMPVSPEYLKTAQANGEMLQMHANFHWNTGVVQFVDFTIVSNEKIVLKKEGMQVYPALFEVSVSHNDDLGNISLKNMSDGSIIATGNNIAVKEGSDVQVVIEAEDGHVIKSVMIDGVEQEVAFGATTFDINIGDINKAIPIQVVYGQLFEISCTVNGNGSLDIEPSIKTTEKIYLVEGSRVTVTGEPAEGQYIKSVSFCGNAENLVDKNQYSKTIEAVQSEYQFEITFSPYMYNITATKTQNGEVVVSEEQVAYGSNVQIELKPNAGYTVESLIANGDKEIVVTKNDRGAYLAELVNVTENFELTATFKEIAYAESPYFDIDTTDVLIRNADDSLYVIGSKGKVTFSTNQAGIILQTDEGEYLGGWSTPTASVSKDCVVTAIWVCYKHPDEWFPELHKVEVSKKEIVVDNEKPIASLVIKTNAANDNIYNEDVKVGYIVKDVEENADSSKLPTGIKSIEYSIIDLNDGEKAIDSGILYTYDAEQQDSVDYEISSTDENHITVPSTISENVKVVLTVKDRADNVTEIMSSELKFCTVPPRVQATISGEKQEGITSNYYCVPRVLTLTVIDSSNGYNDDALKNGLLIKKNNNPISEEEFNKNLEVIKNDNDRIIKYTFEETGHYTWSYSYVNNGNLENNPIEIAEGCKDVYDFYVDVEAPVITVDFDNNACQNGSYFKNGRVATIEVEEHYFDEEATKVRVNGEVQSGLKWDKHPAKANTHIATCTFDQDGHYTFELASTDLAGNECSEITTVEGTMAPWDFTVDTSAPTDLSIEYLNEAGAKKIIGDKTYAFYNADEIQVKIQATDDISDIDYLVYSYVLQDGVSNINVGKSDVKISSEELAVDENNMYYTIFSIPAQFRGIVSFKAYNKAGVCIEEKDATIRVVDTKNPEIAVSYDNNAVLNGKFYNALRKATITIDEANFFEQDLQAGLLTITIKKDGIGVDTVNTFEFEYNEEKGVYEETYLFNEDAEYTFDIAYTDGSGNPAEDYPEDKFVIDRINPQISINKANGAFISGNRTVTICVKEKNFRASDFKFEVSATDITGTKEVDLSKRGYAEYLEDEANWKLSEAGDWQAKLIFEDEGKYKITANYSDLAGNPAEKVTDTFCIDKNAPQNLKISYVPEFIEETLGGVKFGFFKGEDISESVTVKVEATDEYAGVSHFICSYEVEAGASSINNGMIDIRVNADRAEGNNMATASFEIPAQFRGTVTIVAYDEAGNYSGLQDEKVLVVDDIAPEITVGYDNNEAENNTYFDKERKAIITINEANFFGTSDWEMADLEDANLMLTVEKVGNDGTKTTTQLKPEFKGEGDNYKAEVSFDEDADYTFSISYKDRSQNEGISAVKDTFTIDKKAPVIAVSYDNNDCRNDEYFNAKRIATVSITEHNFDISGVELAVSKNGTPDDSYTQYIADTANWTHNGDIHTIELAYNEEAHYTFEIKCTDKAGNSNADVLYGESKAPNKFMIDMSAPNPDLMKMEIGEDSVAGDDETFAFDKFYKEAVTVKLQADCDISGVGSLKYQKVAKLSDYKADENWVEYIDEKGIVILPSDKCIIFFKAEDKAGNYTIIRSTGIIVDNKEPSGERNAPEIDIIPASPNANGYYAGNVSVDLKVVDPKYLGEIKTSEGFYSGLSNISGKIYTTDTEAVQTIPLFDAKTNNSTGAVVDEDNLVSSWSGKIEIDAKIFNSNNVIVEIIATDNTGNTRTTTTKAGLIRIDTTAPLVDISYNNNSAVNEKIFNADRTATIVVTERNFRPEDMKIVLTNTDGVVPGLSNWTQSAGTGNLDDTKWTATINYSADGDYTFSAAYTDVAGNGCQNVNYGNNVAPTDFTIDKTVPVIAVSYDNNAVKNGNYFNNSRTATIDITEHNFRSEDVSIIMTASDDGQQIAVPVVSNWVANGDRHTATIRFENDGKYTFDIAMSDMAGNAAAEYVEETFIVDKTVPTLSITGVKENSANRGEVVPVITYSDTNYDEQQVVLTLTGANRKSVALDGTYSNIHNGRVFTFKDFAYEKSIDDIYVLSATITDRAGNVAEESITFSVNRFGSNYVLSKKTEDINGKYVQKTEDIVVKEINANELIDIKITLFKNNETITLKKDSDYSVDVKGGNGEWYEYTYTIFAENFDEDGIYRLAFYSEDGAGNIAENTLDTKNTEISLGVDKTKPNVIMVNLENDVTYAVENLTVYMTVSDNLLLNSVKLYLDDYNKEYKVWEGEELAAVIAGNGEFTFDVPGDSKRAHKVKVVCCDAAGNERVEEITDFFVTTDVLILYFNNKPLFFGSIGGVILVIGLIIFFVGYRRKSNQM